jgi:hypothetical protein
VEGAVVSQDAEEASCVESGGYASIAASFFDVDTLAANPGGGCREAFVQTGLIQRSPILLDEAMDFFVERTEQIDEKRLSIDQSSGLLS